MFEAHFACFNTQLKDKDSRASANVPPPTDSPAPISPKDSTPPTIAPTPTTSTPSPTKNGGAWVLTDAPTGDGSPSANPSTGSPTTPAPTTATPTASTIAPATNFPTTSDNSPVKDYIVSISLQGGTEFEDPNSYQSKALNFVLAYYGPSLTQEAEEMKQLYALSCLYYNTYGVSNLATDQFWLPKLPQGSALPGWRDDDRWMTTPSSSSGGDDDHFCSWFGLTCTNQRVSIIDLHDNRMSGSLPPELGLLQSSLWYLDVHENFIANIGPEQHTFLKDLTKLQYLSIGSTYFANDGIPTELFALTNLVELDISYMLWYGDLGGDGWGQLEKLESISMGGNEYNSSLPEALVTLPNLMYLYSEFTNLEGSLDFIARMPKVEQLWIDLNPMSGSIPTTIGTVQTLKSLSATECELEGSIPSELGSLDQLKQLWMSHNRLTGTIPSELSNLPTLELLHLQDNDLTGSMPQEVCDEVFPFGRISSLQVDCGGDDVDDESSIDAARRVFVLRRLGFDDGLDKSEGSDDVFLLLPVSEVIPNNRSLFSSKFGHRRSRTAALLIGQMVHSSSNLHHTIRIMPTLSRLFCRRYGRMLEAKCWLMKINQQYTARDATVTSQLTFGELVSPMV
eukprot:scaffold2747_cov104-Cylindrotheca_fusiformis.AAC.9